MKGTVTEASWYLVQIFVRPHAAVEGSKRNFEFSKYRDEPLESDVIPSLNSPEGQNMVLQDDNARSQRTRTKTNRASLVSSMNELVAGPEFY